MLESANVAVVVPAYNEARLIARALSGIPSFVDRVVVVDDASTDATAREAARTGDARVEVVRHARNRGVGAAIATGTRIAFDRGADVAAVMAGDAQMDPSDLERVVAPVARGEVDYCKGDRLSHPSVRRTMPPHRWIANHVLSRLTHLATGIPVRDSQCGYAAISRTAARRIELERMWPGYGYPNDLLGRAAAAGLRVGEVTVRPIYADEESGIGIHHGLIVIPLLLARTAITRHLS
ncbi:glycosyltransferase family 2 protein [Sandaracinus amylolyticus]|uniref:glycosyltransferase family 2 protein n=1 Tax=Sandaracinus amylolyticus TaxID=927083 RepID=UPI001F30814E|nr:glycosyltransferase family 2 protein [Sandaracinus amylolyticus]UJR79240.1 Glycosyltransferase involved in cell wall bisynthesis [Sandaracinus amylolyticus]